MNLSVEDAYGPDYVRAMRTDHQAVREELNALPKGKPDQYTLATVRLLKPWDKFYREVLGISKD